MTHGRVTYFWPGRGRGGTEGFQAARADGGPPGIPRSEELRQAWRLGSEIEMGVSQLLLGRNGWGGGERTSGSLIGRDPLRKLACVWDLPADVSRTGNSAHHGGFICGLGIVSTRFLDGDLGCALG